MSGWLRALKAAGCGNSEMAEVLLNEIIISMRYPKLDRSRSDYSYDGPVPKAVYHAINGFTDAEDRQLAQNNAEDLVDYIVELIRRKIHRTIALVEFCMSHPEKNIETVAREFNGLRPLKRTHENLQMYIRVRLRSMLEAGVEFYRDSVAVKQTAASDMSNIHIVAFNELALIKSLPINQKWIDFRQRQNLTYKYESYDELYDGIAAETSDFSNVSSKFAVYSFGRELELIQLRERVAEVLNEGLQKIHNDKPCLGYRHIANHRVWWQYDPDGHLNLSCIEPECFTDEKLAEHISETYNEVKTINRLIAQRRRTKLEDICKENVSQLYQSSREKSQ